MHKKSSKVSGKMANFMEVVVAHLSIPSSLKGIGRMTCQKAEAHVQPQMVITQENFTGLQSTEQALKSILMGPTTLETGNKVYLMAEENLRSQASEAYMMVTLSMDLDKALGSRTSRRMSNMTGPTRRVNGLRIFSTGQVGSQSSIDFPKPSTSTREHLRMANTMDKVCQHVQTDLSTRDSLLRATRRVRVLQSPIQGLIFIVFHLIQNRESNSLQVNGRKASSMAMA